ncbi:ATP-binding protein [Streptomyces sp. G-G2]|uniref:ATP-binding protein n=1 Tax=Streptomyces sp. G-G2 TaxID=3046201 RepID=UPI0024B8A524|nr:ATP-binding protein [Streptomyces sp. G-G2]MDJ0379384.1 ATP-binding protein [Streptomyces sp. G-G2]
MDRTQGQPASAEGTGALSGATSPATTGTGASGAPTAGGLPAGPARVVGLTVGGYLLTVNPVDGSEIEARRPVPEAEADGRTESARPGRRDAASRAARDAAARPPVPPGPPPVVLPLLEREEERERLARLLGRGRSIRLAGPSGSGRTALLDALAGDCADLAPDGVVRLCGHRQTPTELLYALYSTVYAPSESHPDRPARAELLRWVGQIGAVVLLDDLDFGGAALEELLRATPECAWLLAATPDTPPPSDHSHLEEVFLGGLGRAACAELLELAVGRPLTELETAWAGDLRFASEGLALRFVQAGGLLRQRDELNRAAEDGDEEPGVFEERPRDTALVPLPTLAEGAAPAELLASRVSESARAALRFACALDGEAPHPAHLPALVGDTHADAAVAELLTCGLLTAAGTRYRLAAGVARQLAESGFGASGEALTAARHYAWWTGHASVTPERVAAEADAVLAALAGADVVAGVLLARTAAPAFAASLHWGAWERVLRAGAEAARTAGEVAEQAYFHHELGVLALCGDRLGRARAELETSNGLRGALADKRGTVAGRRALALVTDREAADLRPSPPLRLEPPAPPGSEAQTQVFPLVRVAPVPVVPPAAVFEETFPLNPKQPTEPMTVRVPVTSPAPAPGPRWHRRPAALAAAGVLAVLAIGTAVSFAITAGDGPAPERAGTPATPHASAPDTSGNDPAPAPADPGPSSPASASASGSTGRTPSPGTSGPVASSSAPVPGGGGPSRKPGSRPPSPPAPSPASSSPSTSPSSQPTPTPSPSSSTPPPAPGGATTQLSPPAATP